ncbi:hypothetical protein WCD74_01045 [Actinomycetospora sp. OC33-EN08]|uniref:TetR family transcriptional regulator n=1 Tax=Actinomycetospora aurantiaca TaxID=3129233 RepID=A0ABU8MG98_9PSEU
MAAPGRPHSPDAVADVYVRLLVDGLLGWQGPAAADSRSSERGGFEA